MDERTTEERKAQYDSWMDRLNTGKTFRNWNLFRPQIRTKWSTSAYSYGQTAVEAGVDKDTLEISNSTTSMASVQSYDVSKRRKRVILGIVIGIGSLVAVLIPIILIKYLPKPEPSERVSVVDIEATIDNMQYTDQLADKESPEYRNFTLQFCSEIERMFRSSDLKDAYDGCVVTEIRNGSIIVFFKVVFVSQQLPTEKTVKTSLTAKTEISGTGQVLIALGVYKLRQTTVIVGTVVIVDAEYNPVPKIAYENPCRETTSCETDLAECSGRRCVCPFSRYFHQPSDSCILFGSILGGKCSETCADKNADCTGNPEPVCRCKADYFERGTTCAAKISHGNTCNDDGPSDQCSSHGAVCLGSACNCHETHFYLEQNDTCIKMGSLLGGSCTDVCDIDNAHCDEDNEGICLCDINFYNKDGSCAEKKAFESPCVEAESSEQCATHGATCSNDQCRCSETHFHYQQNDTCLLLGGMLGKRCNDMCVDDNALCDGDQERQCVCNENFYNKDGVCIEKKAFGSPCDETGSTEQCATQSATCSSNKCRCIATHFYYQQNDTCLLLGSMLGKRCNDTCVDDNALCDGDQERRCVCDENFYNKDGVCVEKKAFESPCDAAGSTEQCATRGAACSNNKCRCDETHFHYEQNDTCLLPSSASTTTIRTLFTSSSSTPSTTFKTASVVTPKLSSMTSMPSMASTSQMTDNTQRLSTTTTSLTTALASANMKSSTMTTGSMLVSNPTTQTKSTSSIPRTESTSTISTAETSPSTLSTAQQSASESVSTKAQHSSTLITLSKETTKNNQHSSVTKTSPATALTSVLKKLSPQTTSPSLISIFSTQTISKASSTPGTEPSSTLSTSSKETIKNTQFSSATKTNLVTELTFTPKKSSPQTTSSSLIIYSTSQGILKASTTPRAEPSSTISLTEATTQASTTAQQSASDSVSTKRLQTSTLQTSLMETTKNAQYFSKTSPATATKANLVTDKTSALKKSSTQMKKSSAQMTSFILTNSTASTIQPENTFLTSSTSVGQPSLMSQVVRKTSTSSPIIAEATTQTSTTAQQSVSDSVSTKRLQSSTLPTSLMETTKNTQHFSKTSPATATKANLVTDKTLASKKSSTQMTSFILTNSTTSTIHQENTFSTSSTSVGQSSLMSQVVRKTSTSSPIVSTSRVSTDSKSKTTSYSTSSQIIQSTTTTIPAPRVPNIKCMPRSGSVKIGNKMEYSCYLKYIDKVTQIDITKFNVFEENQAGILGSLTKSTDVTLIVEMSENNDTIRIILENVNCMNEGEFTIKINNETSDTVDLIIISDAQKPVLSVPEKVYKSQQTIVTCSGGVGRLDDGSAAVTLEFLIKFQNASDFSAFSKGVETLGISSDSCENRETKQLTFYATDEWQGAEVRCVAVVDDTINLNYSSDSSGPITLLVPDIFFDMESHTVIIGEMLSFACYVKNVHEGENIMVTRGDTKQPVLTVDPNGDIQHSIPHFTSTLTEDKQGTGVIRINFTAQCGDEAKYFCETAGLVATTNITVLNKAETPNLTLSYEIVFGQTPWGDRPSLCEGVVGRPQAYLVVEVESEGSFKEYSEWWEGDVSEKETDCGVYKSQKFYFNESSLGFLNNKQIRCAVRNTDPVINEEMPVSEAKTIRIVPSNYCANKSWEFYEHPYECHYFVNCKTSTPGNLRFKQCGNAAFCPNRTTGCYAASCDNLCSREFTVPVTSTTTTPAPGVPYMKCMPRSGSVKLRSKMEYSCNLLYIDKVTQIDIAKFNVHEKNQAGILGNLTKFTDVTVIVEISGDDNTISFILENIDCKNEGEFTIKINNETSDTVDLRIIADAKKAALNLPENIYKGQQTKVTCSGDVGRLNDGLAAKTLEFQVKFQNVSDFSAYSKGVETLSISSDSCKNIETKQFTFYATNEWQGAEVRCVAVVDDITSLNYSSDSSGPITLLEPGIFFDMESHTVIIGEMLSFACYIKNVHKGENITVTRGDTKQQVLTVDPNGDIQQNLPHFTSTYTVDPQGANVIRINFTAKCEDKAKYFCESSGLVTSTDISVLRKAETPNLTLSYEIVFEQQPWKDRSSLCEGEVGKPPGFLVVEVESEGSFKEYSEWLKGDVSEKETECGVHKSQKFSFKEDSLEFLNNKQIRCAVRNTESFINEEMPVSKAKVIRVVPSSYCANKSFKFYEHPYECHYLVNCNTSGPGNLRFRRCGNATFCPNRHTGCDEVSCDNLCNREFTVPVTTVPTTRGTDPYIECNHTAIGEVDSSLTVYCVIGNADTSYLVNVTVYKDEQTIFNATGNVGKMDSVDHSATLTYESTKVTLELSDLDCNQSETYKFVVNNILEGSTTVIVKQKPGPPEMVISRRFIRNQQAVIKCEGSLGHPQQSRDMHLKKTLADDLAYSMVTENIIEDTSFDSTKCSIIKTIEYTFDATDRWNGAKIQCVTYTEEGELSASPATVNLEEQEVSFIPESPRCKIGEQCSMVCNVSNVSQLTAIGIYRQNNYQPVCNITEGNIASLINDVSCSGKINTNAGSLMVEFSSIQCDDEGKYTCEPNSQASTPTETIVAVYRDPTKPIMTEKPKSMTENKKMLNEEKFVCQADTGYRATASLTLQSDRNGNFEIITGGDIDRQITEGSCRTNETLSTKSIQFDKSWNNTQVRCAVETGKESGIPLVSDTFTIQLLPEKYCDVEEEYSLHPFQFDQYIRCVNQIPHVNTCNGCPPSFLNGTVICYTC